MRALCLVREALHYRRDAYLSGLRAAGFDIAPSIPDPKPGDALVIWNRYGRFHEEAIRFERAGAAVLVTENGWLGKRWLDGEWFSLSVGHHAGAGWFPEGGPERWDGWGVELAPFRASGERVILGQRGIGEPGVAAPQFWAESVRDVYGGRIRPHPGEGPSTPLEEDLSAAGEVLTWSSGAALRALALGIPVRCAFDKWIGRSASSGLIGDLSRDCAARLKMFRRLAWGMWTLDEIRSGNPFARIIQFS